MHDPTEGGLASGLWELSLAAGVGIEVRREAIHVPPESAAICQALDVNPLEAIASGALLLSVQSGREDDVRQAIQAVGVEVYSIGALVSGNAVTLHTEAGIEQLQHPARDALSKLFEDN